MGTKATSTSNERVHSLAGRIMCALRARMKVDTMEQLTLD